MNSFEVDIPMKDHPLVINVQQRQAGNDTTLFDVFYTDKLCGSMFCNEHNVWIYEPHHEAALLLNEDQIKHLGKCIGEHNKN